MGMAWEMSIGLMRLTFMVPGPLTVGVRLIGRTASLELTPQPSCDGSQVSSDTPVSR